MAILRRFPKKNAPKWAEIAQKSILPMSQKSRYRKWANSVGDLNTCTENPDKMSKRNVKRVMTPNLMGLAVGGWGVWVFCSLFKTAKCLLFAEMTTFTNISIASLVDHRWSKVRYKTKFHKCTNNEEERQSSKCKLLHKKAFPALH